MRSPGEHHHFGNRGLRTSPGQVGDRIDSLQNRFNRDHGPPRPPTGRGRSGGAPARNTWLGGKSSLGDDGITSPLFQAM